MGLYVLCAEHHSNQFCFSLVVPVKPPQIISYYTLSCLNNVFWRRHPSPTPSFRHWLPETTLMGRRNLGCQLTYFLTVRCQVLPSSCAQVLVLPCSCAQVTMNECDRSQCCNVAGSAAMLLVDDVRGHAGTTNANRSRHERCAECRVESVECDGWWMMSGRPGSCPICECGA